MAEETHGPIRIWVHCTECKTRKDALKVEFVNIEEDIQGRDLMTFKCHDCETQQRAYPIKT